MSTPPSFLWFLCIVVQAKLRCLHDYHLRLLHTLGPPPSGIDIANTIKYFSQTFLSKFNVSFKFAYADTII